MTLMDICNANTVLYTDINLDNLQTIVLITLIKIIVLDNLI